MKKRLLSGILALTMCFSMTPSIAWGSGMTEFSDGGASGESEKKEEFTDEPEIEEEKEQPATTAGVPEVENGFSDGILDAAQDTSATKIRSRSLLKNEELTRFEVQQPQL